MPFGVEPDLGGAEAAPGDLLTFIQFQNSGTDLGGPDADTLNFGTGLTATRGTGASANVVSVVASGSGGSEAETLSIYLSGATSGSFDGSAFNDWNDASVYTSSADVEWDNATQQIHFITGGIYEVHVQGRVAADFGVWPTAEDNTTFGSNLSAIGSDTTTHFRYSVVGAGGSGPSHAVFTDFYLVNATADSLRDFSLYANQYLNTDGATFSAAVTVKRLGANEDV